MPPAQKISWFKSDEFAQFARICCVLAVLLGIAGSLIATLAAVIFKDMRADAKATKIMVAEFIKSQSLQDQRLAVHDQRHQEHDRRFEVVERYVFPWNSPPRQRSQRDDPTLAGERGMP